MKIKLTSDKIDLEDLQPLKERFPLENNISISETNYFIFKGKIKNQAYSKEAEPIRILKKDKTVEDVIESVKSVEFKIIIEISN